MKEGYPQPAPQPAPGASPPQPAQESRADMLTEIVTHSAQAMLIIDRAGIVRYANPAAAALFGRAHDDLIGSSFGLPLTDGETADLEIIRPSGGVALIEMRIQPIAWAEEQAVLATLSDITARKRGEQLLIESQQFLRSTLDALAANIAILDQQGMILAVNQPWQDFARRAGHDPYRSGVGYNYLSVCDQSVGDDAATAQAVAAGIRAVIAGRIPQFYLEYPCNSLKQLFWFALQVTRFGEGERTRVVVAHEDISQRKRTEQLDAHRREILELMARNQRLGAVCAHLLAMLRDHYPDTVYAALALPAMAVHHTASAALSPADRERLDRWSERQIAALPATLGVLRCPPGDPRWAELQPLVTRSGVGDCWLVPIRSGGDHQPSMLVICRQSTASLGPDDANVLQLIDQLLAIAIEQQEHTRQLAYQAHHDALTGLPNRLLFESQLRRAIEQARRSGSLVAVLFIDLDRFKQINDTLGHTIGDALLVQLARRFEGYVRSADTLARRGGDEFMMVLTDIASAPQVAKVAHRLHEMLRLPFLVSGHELFVSASIGASLFPADGEDADSLQRRADAAMYRAKTTLRNSFQFFDAAMNQTALERLRLENYLRRALERDELDVYYQPLTDIDGRMVGFEALLRWRHPDLGMIPPARFIPLAEELGLIVPIGEWCIAQACRQARLWQAPDRPPLRLAVNVSTVQFSQPGFNASLRAILAESGLDPRLLEIELTESMLIGDYTAVTSQLRELRELGLSLAIDDFGTGYSSLGYLQRLPISVLKIDRSFVADIGGERDASGQAIVSAIVNLAHHMGMHVVAEGVETAEQRDFLRQIGCDLLQGYLYSEPLPPPLFEHLLHGHPLPGALWRS